MRKNSYFESVLPIVNAPKTQHKSITFIMQQLKDRKHQIQERIKTQRQQWQNQQKNDINGIRERINTCNSYSTNKRIHHRFHESHESLDNLKYGLAQKAQQINKIIINRQSTIPQKLKHASNVQFPIVSQKNIKKGKKRKKLIFQPKQLQSILFDLPLDPKDRTHNSIRQLKTFLTGNNMFMSKINERIVTYLLMFNRLICAQKNENIFKCGEQTKAFYIIIEGKIKLYSIQKTGKRVCKICGPGETIGEQIIFSNEHRKITLQAAKSVTKSFLIEMKIESYRKLFEELVKQGYKIAFNQLEIIIKRNYITKNWLRSQQSRLIDDR